MIAHELSTLQDTNHHYDTHSKDFGSIFQKWKSYSGNNE